MGVKGIKRDVFATVLTEKFICHKEPSYITVPAEKFTWHKEQKNTYI